MSSPISLLLLVLSTFLLVNFSYQQLPPKAGLKDLYINWVTGKQEKNPSKLHVYIDLKGKIMINALNAEKPVSFPMPFKDPMNSEGDGGPKNQLYFDMKICQQPGKRCDAGFILCFVGQLDPGNNGVSRTFELNNVEGNKIAGYCNDPHLWNLWKEWEGVEKGMNKKMHGLMIQSHPEDGSYNVTASYSKMDNGNSIRWKPEKENDCFILRFNTDSSIGGSWVPKVGGNAEDRSRDFRRKVHNGAMLDQQDPVFSLPLDILSKFNPANHLFGTFAFPDCGITIAFEGDNLKSCKKPEECGGATPKPICETRYYDAWPATIDMDKQAPAKTGSIGNEVENNEGRKKRGIIDVEKPEAKYVRIGFLKKPVEDRTQPHDFKDLKHALAMDKNLADPWKKYLKHLMSPDAAFRMPWMSMSYDYWKLDSTIETPVLKAINCWDDEFELVYGVFDKDPKQPVTNSKHYQGDFSELEDCCMDSVELKREGPIPVDKIKNDEKWREQLNFEIDRVKVGLITNDTVSQEQKLALLFKYSLSPVSQEIPEIGRGNYLSRDSDKPSDLTNGHLFGPPELAIRKKETYTLKVNIRHPSAIELGHWKDNVILKMEQQVVRCGCEKEDKEPKPPKGERKVKLEMHLPIMMVYPIDAMGKRVGVSMLQESFTVNKGPGVKVPWQDGKREAYDPAWWKQMLLAKDKENQEQGMETNLKKSAQVGDDEVDDPTDREDEDEGDDEEEDEK